MAVILAEWRKEIDELDEQLLRLLNQRAALALKVGQEKRKQGLQIRSVERERKVLENAVARNPGPLDAHAVRRIFQSLIAECCRLEEERSP